MLPGMLDSLLALPIKKPPAVCLCSRQTRWKKRVVKERLLSKRRSGAGGLGQDICKCRA